MVARWQSEIYRRLTERCIMRPKVASVPLIYLFIGYFYKESFNCSHFFKQKKSVQKMGKPLLPKRACTQHVFSNEKESGYKRIRSQGEGISQSLSLTILSFLIISPFADKTSFQTVKILLATKQYSSISI